MRILEYEILEIGEHNFGDTIEIVSNISTEEIGKLGLPVSGASLHYFQKRSTIFRNEEFYLFIQSDLKDSKF